MTLYSHPQLRALVALAGVLTVGLGVREWRAGFPEPALRLERFDRDDRDVPVAIVEDEQEGARPRATASPSGERRTESPAGRPAQVPRPGHMREPSADGPRPSPGDPRPLDLNRASVEQLARLPGIGPELAQRIAEERERRGRFESVDGLRGILGLGPKKLAAIRARLTVQD